jgi:hypothetical protein
VVAIISKADLSRRNLVWGVLSLWVTLHEQDAQASFKKRQIDKKYKDDLHDHRNDPQPPQPEEHA